MTEFLVHPSLSLILDFSQKLQHYHVETYKLNNQSSFLNIVLRITINQSTMKSLNNVNLGNILITKE